MLRLLISGLFGLFLRSAHQVAAVSVIVLAVVALAACEEMPSNPDPDREPSTAEGRLRHWSKPEQLQSLIQGSVSTAHLMSSLRRSSVSPRLSLAGSSATEQQLESCFSYSPEEPTDADQDGWPLSAEYVFNCDSIQGRFSIRDTNDGDPDSSVELVVDDFQLTAVGVSVHYDGTFLFEIDDDGAIQFDYDGSISATAPGIEWDATYSSYSVTLTGSPSSGTVVIDGGLAISWTFDCSRVSQSIVGCEEAVRLLGAPQGSIQIHVHTAGLEFDFACTDTFFTRGQIALRDQSGNTATTRYDGCGQYTTNIS